jgi:hypothetical protein
LNGKGGPSLLVPSGDLISFQSRIPSALFVTIFYFVCLIMKHEIGVVL